MVAITEAGITKAVFIEPVQSTGEHNPKMAGINAPMM